MAAPPLSHPHHQELASVCKSKRLKGFEAIQGVHLVAEHFRCVCGGGGSMVCGEGGNRLLAGCRGALGRWVVWMPLPRCAADHDCPDPHQLPSTTSTSTTALLQHRE